MQDFTSFGLADSLLKSLESLQITEPTPIQAQAIPVLLEGGDLLATAQTGTGKTFAYLLPLVSRMLENGRDQALILAPTRELADQIKNALIQLLGRKGYHQVALLIGGASMFKQFLMLKKMPQFIVGTPGRIIDHLNRGKLRLEDVRYLILDEVDRMLDMGFTEALETILQFVPAQRQTMMFSATLPDNIARMSKKYLTNAKHISVGSTSEAVPKIKQETIKVSTGDKLNRLLEQLEDRDGSVIIFVKTKIGADALADKLKYKGHSAEAIHGDLRQRQRDMVLKGFRNGDHRILVATDVAARGLDVPHIKHVINYDLPQCAEDYIHRIGRTGRAGTEGYALSFICPSEGSKWRMICQYMDPRYKGPRESTQNRYGSGRGHGGRFESRGGERRSERRDDRSGDERRPFKPRGERRDDRATSDERRPFKPRGERRDDRATSDERRPFKPRGERRDERAAGDERRPFKPRGERSAPRVESESKADRFGKASRKRKSNADTPRSMASPSKKRFYKPAAKDKNPA